MFDNAYYNKGGNVTNTFVNHSANGLLCKSMINSRIVRFDKDSELEDNFFNIKDPHRERYDYSKGVYEKIPVIVLQVILINDESFLVEFIDKDDYEKELNSKKEEGNL